MTPTNTKNTKTSEAVRAYNYACRLLARREYSTYEVRTKLQKKYTQEITEKVINQLLEFGFINDERFTGSYVRSRLLFKPRSQYALSLELRKKGIAQDVVDTYFAENPIDEKEAARRLIDSKNKTLSQLVGTKRKEKIAYYLSSRGFSLRLIDLFA